MSRFDEQHGEEREIARIASFSDGVFAIAITLLALDLQIPDELSAARLDPTLVAMWPKFLSFALSFVIIAAYWRVHHRIFRWLVRYDDRFVRINLLVLFTIVFLPFPTSVLGEYGDTRVGVMFYAAALAVSGFATSGLWYYMTQGNRLVASTMDQAYSRRIFVQSLVTPVMFAASVPVALVGPGFAQYVWVMAAIAHPVLEGVTQRRQRRKKEDGHE